MITHCTASPIASRIIGCTCRPYVAAMALALFLACGCDPHGEEGRTQGAEDIQVSLRKAQAAIGRREEPLLAQMLATARICEEKAAAQRAAGNIRGAEALERTALVCYQDAHGAGRTIPRKRTLAFPGEGGIGTIHIRPWDFAQPWEVVGPAEGTVTIEKNMMVQFAASPNLQDEHVKALAGFHPGTIQYLNLGEARQLTDASLETVCRMKGLLDLSLYGTAVTDRGIAVLAALPYLRQVNLMHTQVTPEGVCALAGMLPGLVELALEDAQAVDKTVWALRQCPNLERFVCKRGQLTDVGASYLGRLQHLQCLWLGGRRITDYSVPLLTQLKGLNELVLMETSVTETGISALKAGLPECRVSSS